MNFLQSSKAKEADMFMGIFFNNENIATDNVRPRTLIDNDDSSTIANLRGGIGLSKNKKLINRIS